MKKQMLTILLIVIGMLISVEGCNSVELEGFSIGVAYLNTDMTTTNSVNIGSQQFTGDQTTKIEGLMPTFSLNFKFK